MARPRKLSLSERREAVLMLLRQEETPAMIARRLEISEHTLCRWRDEFLAAGEAGLTGKSDQGSSGQEIKQLKREIAKRDQIIGEVTVANRILKKLSGESA